MEHISKPIKRVSESVILKQVMLEACKLGLVVFRNHVGGFYDKDGRFHRVGLCVGSSDLIGWERSTGRFVAIEVKAMDGKASKAQENFLNQVKAAGGIAIVCDNPKNLQKLLDEFA